MSGPRMAFVEGQTINGWGVFRGDPWHFDSIHDTQVEAQARAAELGEGYEVKFGQTRAGTDDFAYGNIGDTSSGNYRRVTLGGAPITFQGRQLVMQFAEPEDEEVKPSGPAYFIGEDRFTPSQFRRLSKRRKVEAMAQWFLANYEDPVHRTSYNGREGGYLWNHGGPYDADVVLQEEFSDLADFDVIQEAVTEVTSDGIFEWAPVASGDDYDNADRPDGDGIYSIDEPLPDISDFDFDQDEDVDEDGEDTSVPVDLTPGQAVRVDQDGNVLVTQDGSVRVTSVNNEPSQQVILLDGPFAYLTDSNGAVLTDGEGNALIEQYEEDLAHRREVERNLNLLDKAVDDLRYLAISRSHNHPPELVDDIPLPNPELVEIKDSIAALRTQLSAIVPNLQAIEKERSTLSRLGGGIKYLMEEYALKGVALAVGIDYLKGDHVILTTLHTALVSSAEAVGSWLQYLYGLGLS
jgi:hypothetical protein